MPPYKQLKEEIEFIETTAGRPCAICRERHLSSFQKLMVKFCLWMGMNKEWIANTLNTKRDEYL